MIGDFFQFTKMVHLASVLSVIVFIWTTNAQVNENLPVRLTGSGSPNEGLVEVFYQDQWGTICDDDWDILDGEVICRQLGFESIYKVKTWGKAMNQPDKPIHLDDMQCYGYELNIGFCKGVYGQHNCHQTENAGVICTTNVPSSTNNLVRLVNGGSDDRGRVEVYYESSRVWGTVCDDSWDILDAGVVCQQLGFDRALNALSGGMFGNGEGVIVLDDAECDGTESKIQDCYGKWGSNMHNCDHNEDAGVQCSNDNQDNSPLNAVRLVGGAYPNQGRVEVMLNGDWGTVCDDSWDLLDAQVVCRQLNFGGAYRATFGGTFPDGYGDILLDDLDCVGSEAHLFQCRRSDLGLHNCQHSEDAGVVCLSDEYPLDTEGSPGAGFGFEFELSGISAGLFIVIPICFCVVVCTICRKWCKGANANSQPTLAEQQAVSNFQYATSNSPAAQQSNQPYSPAMDYHSVPTAPPPLTNIPQPVTAPDMPPGYDSVMEDPNKYGIPPTNGVIPVTPPPAYTPQMVMFNSDTNTVNLNVEEQQYQQNSSNT